MRVVPWPRNLKPKQRRYLRCTRKQSMSKKELPKYVSHKTVSAVKLELVIHRPNPDLTGKTAAGSHGGYLHPVDTSFSPIEVSAAYMTKHVPRPGGYYVKYEDGYESFSPAAAFEAGYTALSDQPTSGAGSIGAAFYTLKTAMKEDLGYAWSWHCNLAMPIMDAIGVSHADANKAAARLVSHLFGLDTSTHEHYPQQEVETKTLADVDPPLERSPTADQAIEQQIQAKGKTAPRVTPDRLKEVITSEHYFTAFDGAQLGQWGGISEDAPGAIPALSLLTFCVLVLRNGFTVTGESACASPENFDAEIGQNIARANAIQKIWPLEGYLLKQKLSEGGAA